ncbi:MAG: hypothetical protein IRZ16_07230 [Myxococcaceae bacterium]|nr:hypothetical protein [Myxococcaceae bacterium]
MDGTRVERRRTPLPDKRRITEPLPSAIEAERTRIKAGARVAPRGLGMEERVALFAHSLLKDKAGPLLEGFSEAFRERALAYLAELATLPSSERQGRLAFEFGIRPDASRRLREVWAEAGPGLRREMFQLLPPFHRTNFPDYVLEPVPPDEPVAPGLKAFAARLILEATR